MKLNFNLKQTFFYLSIFISSFNAKLAQADVLNNYAVKTDLSQYVKTGNEVKGSSYKATFEDEKCQHGEARYTFKNPILVLGGKQYKLAGGTGYGFYDYNPYSSQYEIGYGDSTANYFCKLKGFKYGTYKEGNSLTSPEKVFASVYDRISFNQYEYNFEYLNYNLTIKELVCVKEYPSNCKTITTDIIK